jgi:hypothetical protein
MGRIPDRGASARACSPSSKEALGRAMPTLGTESGLLSSRLTSCAEGAAFSRQPDTSQCRRHRHSPAHDALRVETMPLRVDGSSDFAAIFAAEPEETVAYGKRLWSSRDAKLNSSVGSWDRLEQSGTGSKPSSKRLIVDAYDSLVGDHGVHAGSRATARARADAVSVHMVQRASGWGKGRRPGGACRRR